ncbi:hypothetical protein [Flavobacterium sp. UBA7663]|uniref:hypothetical protein n=1 Tax=Flavobacterium sp. UBA7663 TaxID=1946557 RepID=UPI0025C615D6|nr:hypothetical protein [Flavobacterium sp. UBA7663]
MEIIDKKRVKYFTITTAVISGVIAVIPIAMYFWNFRYGLSDSKADWGTFGDFIGGVVGTIFSLIAVIFSLISIYISLRIAARIHDSEKELHKENITHDVERFKREKELIELQNKPVPYFNLTRFPELTKVELMNNGTGTLIVNKIKIFHKGIYYPNFSEFLTPLVETDAEPEDDIIFYFNSAPTHVLSPGSSKKIFKLYPENNIVNKAFTEYQSGCRDLLKDSKITIDYEDIFGNTFEYSYDLIYLKN